jgi:hypothetical protein
MVAMIGLEERRIDVKSWIFINPENFRRRDLINLLHLLLLLLLCEYRDDMLMDSKSSLICSMTSRRS